MPAALLHARGNFPRHQHRDATLSVPAPTGAIMRMRVGIAQSVPASGFAGEALTQFGDATPRPRSKPNSSR
jgi:hypothetical protein